MPRSFVPTSADSPECFVRLLVWHTGKCPFNDRHQAQALVTSKCIFEVCILELEFNENKRKKEDHEWGQCTFSLIILESCNKGYNFKWDSVYSPLNARKMCMKKDNAIWSTSPRVRNFAKQQRCAMTVELKAHNVSHVIEKRKCTVQSRTSISLARSSSPVQSMNRLGSALNTNR